MNSLRFAITVSIVTLCFANSSGASAQVFSDDFNSLTIDSRTVSQGYMTCKPPPDQSDPENISISVPSGSGNWAMWVPTNYSLTWVGTNATQTWATSGDGYMGTHTEMGGTFWLSRVSFDRTKDLSAVGRLSMNYCSDTTNGACMAGFTLLGSEADYREISLWAVPNAGSLEIRVARFAPCNFRYLTDANGNYVTVPFAQFAKLRIDYLGAEGGGWHYWLNGNPLYIDTGAGPATLEPGTFDNASLKLDPHLGLYFTENTGFVEGKVDYTKVYKLQQLTFSSASASTSGVGSPPSYAYDGNASTLWNSNAGAPQWIEFDLGAVKTIRKIRLLPGQYPTTASTVHKVYVGNSPAPTALQATLSGTTIDNQWVDVDLLESGVSGRYVRITTTSSPSSVAWREVVMYQ